MSEQLPPQSSKEIDLIDVTGKIFYGIEHGITNLFKWVKRQIILFFRLFLTYWWLFCTLLIIGGTFGYFKAKIQRPFYETEMLAEATVIPRIQLADRINSLQNLISEGGNQALANQLELNINEVKSIFSIKAEITEIKVEGKATKIIRKKDKDGVEIEETVVEPNPQFIRISIRVWENQSIRKIEQALLTFTEKDPYIREQTDLAKRTNLLQQEAIQFEIQQLMLFQKKNIEKSSLSVTSSNSPLMIQNEEKTYVDEILSLKNQLAYLQQNYDLLRPLIIVQPFTPFENPVNKGLTNILFFMLLFFGIGYGAMLLYEGWKRI